MILAGDFNLSEMHNLVSAEDPGIAAGRRFDIEFAPTSHLLELCRHHRLKLVQPIGGFTTTLFHATVPQRCVWITAGSRQDCADMWMRSKLIGKQSSRSDRPLCLSRTYPGLSPAPLVAS